MSLARNCPLLLLVLASSAFAQTIEVPNPSFEQGAAAQPAGWTLAGGKGQWLDSGAADGKRAVAVTGTGDDNSFWRCGPIPMTPKTVYRLALKARRIDGQGGTPVTGPAFANRDLGDIPAEWKTYESVFVTPDRLQPDEAYLRFGQWHMKGSVAFDAVQLTQAQPVYARQGDLALGEGERIEGQTYEFTAPLGRASGNHSRPLAGYTCTFNSNRWCLTTNQEVVYRHRIAGRTQTSGEVQVDITWHEVGDCEVEASKDGKSWQSLGRIGKVAGQTFRLPDALFPAEETWIRLSARPAVDADRARASLQVAGYVYKAALSGMARTFTGTTHFLAIRHTDPRLQVTIEELGEAVPGGRNEIRGRVKNLTNGIVPYNASARTWREGQSAGVTTLTGASAGFRPGEEEFLLGYEIAGPGRYTLQFTMFPAVHFEACATLDVPDLYDASYGERLPASSGAVGLWWASPGWKVSRTRPAPDKTGEAVVIGAARNETEAVQLVVRPAKALKGFLARAEALKGPGGATISAENVEILRVRYLMVTHPTDSTGCVGLWPDPLPPVTGTMDLEEGKNQPLWIRVRVPKDAKAGTYAGRIVLAAEGYSAEAPLKVEVFDFAMPDRMTCTTSFGFDPSVVWRYHKLERAEDRRAVLHKYLAALAAHHIAPYEPVPLDPIKVTWPKGADGKPTLAPQFEWAAWDAAMTRALDRYHFNSFVVHVPGMGGGTFFQRVEPELLGYKENTPEYKTALANYCQALQSHLKEKGWLGDAYIYWFDEPDTKDFPFVANGFRKLKEAAPGLARMITKEPEPGLVGGPNIWCPITPQYNHDRAEERRREGEKFWWYVCCGPKAPYTTLFIDHPATEMRVWLWQTWQRKIEGILIWSTNYWTSGTAYTDPKHPQNPYEDPASWVDGYGVAKGTKQLWGNGDGRFLYPPAAAADAAPPGPVLEGPVDSIRLEMLRDGIEDYEYLAILRRLLAQRGARLEARQRADFTALLEVPAEITKDMTTFTKDPGPIERRREAIARAIEALSKM
jgi:hypothetical protein